jgi:hypothetical protein
LSNNLNIIVVLKSYARINDRRCIKLNDFWSDSDDDSQSGIDFDRRTSIYHLLSVVFHLTYISKELIPGRKMDMIVII